VVVILKQQLIICFKLKEMHDENRYIYKFNGDDLRCVYGYLTNRDENPEKVIGWIIISGEEYCKETPGVGMWM
jgi:hypothetical protein